jgi:small nuclear ribonucleoprotein
MVNGIDRPLDLLNTSKGKEILVQLKNGKQFVGNLLAFDIHINVVLDNAKEIENGEQTTSFGRMFLRGDMIVFISPSSAAN